MTCLSLVELLLLPIILYPMSWPFWKSECNVKISCQARIREGFIVLTVSQVGWQIKRCLFFVIQVEVERGNPPQPAPSMLWSLHCQKPFRVPADYISWADKAQAVSSWNARELFSFGRKRGWNVKAENKSLFRSVYEMNIKAVKWVLSASAVPAD